MYWDPIEHREKVAKRKAEDARRLKNYWPFYCECNTCDAPEGKPCWNLHDRRSRIHRNPKDWKYNFSAHPKRIRMTKVEFKARQEELYQQKVEEHKIEMLRIKREAGRFGIYID